MRFNGCKTFLINIIKMLVNVINMFLVGVSVLLFCFTYSPDLQVFFRDDHSLMYPLLPSDVSTFSIYKDNTINDQVLQVIQKLGYRHPSLNSLTYDKEIELEYALKDPVWNRDTLFRPDNPKVGMEHYLGKKFIQLPLAHDEL